MSKLDPVHTSLIKHRSVSTDPAHDVSGEDLKKIMDILEKQSEYLIDSDYRLKNRNGKKEIKLVAKFRDKDATDY